MQPIEVTVLGALEEQLYARSLAADALLDIGRPFREIEMDHKSKVDYRRS